MSTSAFRVGRSIAGLGLFTNTSLKENEFVIEYVGEKIPTPEADARGGKYLFEINSKWTIDGKARSNLARYINHSCKPNCESRIVGGKIKIYAIRNIAPGEELTYDYGPEYFAEHIAPFGCRCGQKRHRSKTED